MLSEKKVRFEASPDSSGISTDIISAYNTLYDGTGVFNHMRDWLFWPQKFFKSEEYERLKNTAQKIRLKSKHVVVIGIGGSYLGAQAIIEAQMASYKPGNPKIHFAGNDLSTKKLLLICNLIGDEDFSIVYISKSGGTIEPAIAFRFFYSKLLEKYGKDADSRVYAVTDKNDGTLHDLAKSHSWESFVIPNGIGGRYSVFTPVGLLPCAILNIDTDEILCGATEASKLCALNLYNPATKYAQWRYSQFNEKYLLVEFLAANNPELLFFCEWWKQLFGESEGKDFKGIFPASGIFPTDLHSLGQYLQQGPRELLCETFVIQDSPIDIYIPKIELEDGLDALAGTRTIEDANKAAMDGSFIAHSLGIIPNSCSKFYVGSSLKDLAFTMQVMMTACAISSYALEVNPFDQPGVQLHKANMKKLLFK